MGHTLIVAPYRTFPVSCSNRPSISMSVVAGVPVPLNCERRPFAGGRFSAVQTVILTTLERAAVDAQQPLSVVGHTTRRTGVS